jgi:hypothetical protein
MRTLTLIIFIFIFKAAQAQLKVSLSGGFSSNTKHKTDSVFFSNAMGLFSQLNASYSWGRVGLGVKGATINHNPKKELTGDALPALDTLRNRKSSGGGVRSNALMIGPEICLCSKNIKITPAIKIGALFHKADSAKITGELQQQKYVSQIDDKTSFGVNPSVTVAYKFNRVIGISFHLDYWRYNIKTKITDFRRGLNNPILTKQPQRLFNTGLGLYLNL